MCLLQTPAQRRCNAKLEQCAVAAGPGRGFKAQRIVRQVVREGGEGDDTPRSDTSGQGGGDDEDDDNESAILSESDSDTEEAVLKRRSEVERQMKKNFRAFMATSKGDEWLLPDTGLVELVVVYRPQRTKKWQAVRGLGSDWLVCNVVASPLASLCDRRRATECRR